MSWNPNGASSVSVDLERGRPAVSIVQQGLQAFPQLGSLNL